MKPGMMVHVFYPSTWEIEAEGSLEMKASLAYIERLFLKTKQAQPPEPEQEYMHSVVHRNGAQSVTVHTASLLKRPRKVDGLG